ncbi:hypothetical protein P1X14_01000 [Sphingomonas sp. AOB5]|uniref:hypothetical protein n=1 Tax=Sphingomonas sp. AOB5 TaxID=3034017 RepID=UPI0023F8BF80|nr:hypothetical protein [Sphingomonas sp. AOB5]MDF7773810.1 hypothetical protein [Sphingomonas sp. AOB5]
MIRKTIALLTGLLLTLAALPAAAQQSYAVPKGAPFVHKHSGLKLPDTLLGMPMSAIREVAEDQLDIFFNYQLPGRNELVSVYIYRLPIGGVPVWFDRARHSIESRTDVYGTVTPLGVTAFAPPRQTSTSGLALVYRLAGTSPFRSTGLALLPMGEWLVKIRYSSDSLSAEALAPRLRAVLDQLGWPAGIANSVPARPVRPCTTPLALSGEARELVPDEETLSADGSASLRIPTGEPAGTVPEDWCLDPTTSPVGGIYRPADAPQGYLLTINDAGRAVFVTPVAVERGAKPAWVVQLIEAARTVNFLRHDRLPSPDQAVEIVNSGRYGSITTTFGLSRTITINSEWLK